MAKAGAGKSWASTSETAIAKKAVPEGVFIRCEACGEMIFRKAIENNLWVCPQEKCQHHFRISASQRIEQLCDPGSFEPFDAEMTSVDALHFVDVKPYPERLEAERRKTAQNEAVQAGQAFIKGRRLILACLDLKFMMGSMGSVVGEKLTRAIETAMERNLPVVIVSCSGGARMQESGLSLMQMAKTSAALAQFDDQGGLFISVLTDPTTGGVTASFAMLGDVILAEPKALIGFAGPRVIQQTIRQELPDGFQRAEFLRDCGFIDRVVPRSKLKDEIARIIDFAGK
jgi:acetyl-CoA carboxylase carboxyl transferase subunit beta